MARGTGWTNFTDFYNENGTRLTSDAYQDGIANSIMMNSEAELDTLLHKLVTTINDLFSPLTTVAQAYEGATMATYTNAKGETVQVDASQLRILDEKNCPVGSDLKLPPRELFVRNGTERYTLTEVQLDNATEPVMMYLYNEEDLEEASSLYTMKNISIDTPGR